MDDFFIVLDKPLYQSSFYALKHFKKKFKKVGHSGTLDPFAQGLLLLGVNRALKFFQFLPETKEYVFDITFGFSTDSDDLDGKITNVSGILPTQEQILLLLPNFIGKITQTPSRFSALKINGQRAYVLARQGVDFHVKSRVVEIFNLQLLSFDGTVAKFSVASGRGFYVRSLCFDICKSLGVLGCVTFLKRTKSDGFSLENIDQNISLNCMLNFYPSIYLPSFDILKLKNGVCLEKDYDFHDQKICIINDTRDFVGLVFATRGMLFSLYML